ncbi:MAG: hypothetical protein E7600_04825 [Ruminococcaceae bacterium]|nr:hypothetical protein [Oscillospiraceae bacterium]
MIELKNPGNGACVSLQTSVQKEFIRDGRKYLTGQLDLQSFRWQYHDYFDASKPSRISFRWEAKDALSSIIEISKTADFSEIFVSAVARNRYDGYNFEIGTTYYWRVKNPREESEVFSFSTEETVPRFMNFDGTTNVRDLGGHATEDGFRIKQGLVYRGAELDMHQSLTDDGKKVMHEVLGIKTDLDLRGEAVGFTQKSPIGDDTELVQVPLCAYTEYIQEQNFEALRKIFSLLADEKNYPFYFHCWGGADRTGCLAFTIEAICGADEETLMKDFELTSLSGLGNVKNRDEEDFATMVKTLRGYGKNWRERMTNFLIVAGVSVKNIEKIREIMLEKADFTSFSV